MNEYYAEPDEEIEDHEIDDHMDPDVRIKLQRNENSEPLDENPWDRESEIPETAMT